MIPQTTKPRFTCLNCQANFENADSQRSHFKTEWHMYNLKRKVCNLNSISQDDFNKIHDMAHPASEVETKTTNKPAIESLEELELSDSESDSGDWIDEDELVDEDYDEAEAAEMLAKVVPEDTCLFCNEKGADIAANVKHMDLMHGFFIPEEQYLIDREGLLEYLGFKVGAGATCLWCSKQFSSLHGVRLHMLHKDHCKIRYDQEKAIEEFKDFYDYTDQVQIPMKPLNELAIPKRRSERYVEHQRALALKLKSTSSHQSKQVQLMKKNPAVVAGTYQSKSIKKFNAQHAKRLLHIGMTNNQAVRGRLRRQNPM